MSENKDDVLGPIRERDAKFFNFDHSRADMSWVAKRWVPEHDRRSLLAIVDSQSSTIESLRRELDAVRRDGERYRWLRKQMPADAITIESTRPRPATRSLHLSEDEADSAIDAAISEARGRE